MPILSTIVGKRLHSVQKKDYSWFFIFSEGVSISTESPWRFINVGRVAVTSEDHGHQFGLPQPVDAASSVCLVLEESKITSARIDKATGDLFIVFHDDAYLQFVQLSCGYESWHLCTPGNEAFCMGGGEITFFSEEKSE